MFSSKNNKNNEYPCKPQFYYIKVGFKGVKIIEVCFRDDFPDGSPFNVNPSRHLILLHITYILGKKEKGGCIK